MDEQDWPAEHFELTTVVARICLNTLRSRAARREQPIDSHVPDPVVSAADAVNPEDAHRKIVEMNILTDPDRLGQLDLTVLGR